MSSAVTNENPVILLGKELSKVEAKQKAVDEATASIDQLLQMVRMARQTCASDPAGVASMVARKMTSLGVPGKITAARKELHVAISKLGKTIDKLFLEDVDKVSFGQTELDDAQVCAVIARHLVRRGRLDTARALMVKENGSNKNASSTTLLDTLPAVGSSAQNTLAGTKRPAPDSGNDVESTKPPGAEASGESDMQAKKMEVDDNSAAFALSEADLAFQVLGELISALRGKNLEPATRWAEANQSELSRHGSNLLFLLQRLRFLDLAAANTLEAVQFARNNFGHFGAAEIASIRKLMTMLLQLAGNASRESRKAFETERRRSWSAIEEELTRAYCAVIGVASESPLQVAVSCGVTALPLLIKLTSVMQGKLDWTTESLPVEIDLGPQRRYHSVFACPVSKEQSNDANPPVLLVCGHVLCRASVARLAKNLHFKCPYCPTQQNVSQTKEIHF